jgi:hypothetical protein
MYNPYIKTVQQKPTYNVYDPFTNEYSIGWILMYIGNKPDRWVPVWRDKERKSI